MATRAPLHPLLRPPAEPAHARALGIALLVAAAVTAGAAWWLLQDTLFAAALLASLLAAVIVGASRLGSAAAAHTPPRVDWALLEAAFRDGNEAVMIVDRESRPVLVNPAYEQNFGTRRAIDPARLGGDGAARLDAGMRTALRDGAADVADLMIGGERYGVLLRRAGWRADHVVQRFRRAESYDPIAFARSLVLGRTGQRLGGAGVMAALADPQGLLIAGNAAFLRRALGEGVDPAGADLASLLAYDADGSIRLARDAADVPPIRIVMIPVGEEVDYGPAVFLLLDEDPEVVSAAAARGTATQHLHSLLAMLPLGVALVERDGRVLFMNEAFGRAAHLTPADTIIYPSDLVGEEDKSIVSDAVRRFAQGRALPGDLAVRLKHRPDEPVAMTIANAKGLGEAAVLLSLKDNSEESKLKRQIAQATKMQAVGQLAGGVAHDFNNILTAIIGHCDLMMMRHTLGDSDYDDIQQIKTNSNRAAALTRQLLAFSRQQTLRPQVLQLGDVISEISSLLRRLLGERVRLDVKHGRNLGAVRADPGQLEQVIVNLAVNARDAMQSKDGDGDGGTLTVETYAVSPADVRKMHSEIMPIAAYTALRVTDTGGGIPDEIIGKIFEPFFTTKEVGKGTGLGLSTVYGIVKQTDGFIFAESELGKGTSFVIYLPVHKLDAPAPEPVPVRVDNGDLWGSGTLLLVEDEATVRAVAERALARQGYRVLTATNGEEALEILEGGETIDLLVTDVVMPMMDGPALVRAARARLPDLKVLFMSGYAEEQLRKSIDIDRVAFLAKPFSVQQLGQAARDTLVAGGEA